MIMMVHMSMRCTVMKAFQVGFMDFLSGMGEDGIRMWCYFHVKETTS